MDWLAQLVTHIPNKGKQIVKAPKLHFFDSGLVCYLPGIREPEQMRLHPLRGAIFESWVVSGLYKANVHIGRQPGLFHYREARGPEIDLFIEQGQSFAAVEVKSGATVAGDFFRNITSFSKRMALIDRPYAIKSYVVFGGEESQNRSLAQVLSWRHVHRIVEHEM